LQESLPGCWNAVTKTGDFSAYRTFTGAKVSLGRCDVFWAGKAIYRSREAQAKVCEGCYARLVRERNGRAGVR